MCLFLLPNGIEKCSRTFLSVHAILIDSVHADHLILWYVKFRSDTYAYLCRTNFWPTHFNVWNLDLLEHFSHGQDLVEPRMAWPSSIWIFKSTVCVYSSWLKKLNRISETTISREIPLSLSNLLKKRIKTYLTHLPICLK